MLALLTGEEMPAGISLQKPVPEWDIPVIANNRPELLWFDAQTDYFVIVRHLPAHTLYGTPLLGCLKAGIKQEHIPVAVQQLTIGSFHPPVVA